VLAASAIAAKVASPIGTPRGEFPIRAAGSAQIGIAGALNSIVVIASMNLLILRPHLIAVTAGSVYIDPRDEPAQGLFVIWSRTIFQFADGLTMSIYARCARLLNCAAAQLVTRDTGML
jgi:hypothetical protein